MQAYQFICPEAIQITPMPGDQPHVNGICQHEGRQLSFASALPTYLLDFEYILCSACLVSYLHSNHA
jgi:hypothetical protein